MISVFGHDGESQFEGVWTAITAAKGFDSVLLDVPKEATHWVRYTTGGTAALRLNELLTGGTSSAKCRLVGKATEVGTAGSGDTGILLVNAVVGTFQAETLTGGVSTGTVAIIQDLIPLITTVQPKAALITVKTAAIQFTLSGVTPTAIAGTNHGHQMDAGQSYVIRGYNNIRKFKCINAVASNGAIVEYSMFF
jgi:hypothetical protein